jgi:hypothetical protein
MDVQRAPAFRHVRRHRTVSVQAFRQQSIAKCAHDTECFTASTGAAQSYVPLAWHPARDERSSSSTPRRSTATPQAHASLPTTKQRSSDRSTSRAASSSCVTEEDYSFHQCIGVTNPADVNTKVVSRILFLAARLYFMDTCLNLNPHSNCTSFCAARDCLTCRLYTNSRRLNTTTPHATRERHGYSTCSTAIRTGCRCNVGGGDSFHAVSLQICGPTYICLVMTWSQTHMFSLDIVPTLSGPSCMQLCHTRPCLRQAHTHTLTHLVYIYRVGTTGFGLPYMPPLPTRTSHSLGCARAPGHCVCLLAARHHWRRLCCHVMAGR